MWEIAEASKSSSSSNVRAATASIKFWFETGAFAQDIAMYLRPTGVRVGTCCKTACSSTGRYSPGLSDSFDTACIIKANSDPLKSDTRSTTAAGMQLPRIGPRESLAAAKETLRSSLIENSAIFGLAALPSDSRNSTCVHPDWEQTHSTVAILLALKWGTHCKLHAAIWSHRAGSRAPDLANPQTICSTSMERTGPLATQAETKSISSGLSVQSNKLRPWTVYEILFFGKDGRLLRIALHKDCTSTSSLQLACPQASAILDKSKGFSPSMRSSMTSESRVNIPGWKKPAERLPSTNPMM